MDLSRIYLAVPVSGLEDQTCCFYKCELKNRTLTNIQDTQQEQQRSTQLHKDAHLRKVISKPPPWQNDAVIINKEEVCLKNIPKNVV